MLSMLVWVPRILQFFGMFRGVVGVVGPLWPRISAYFRQRHGGAARASIAM